MEFRNFINFLYSIYRRNNQAQFVLEIFAAICGESDPIGTSIQTNENRFNAIGSVHLPHALSNVDESYRKSLFGGTKYCGLTKSIRQHILQYKNLQTFVAYSESILSEVQFLDMCSQIDVPIYFTRNILFEAVFEQFMEFAKNDNDFATNIMQITATKLFELRPQALAYLEHTKPSIERETEKLYGKLCQLNKRKIVQYLWVLALRQLPLFAEELVTMYENGAIDDDIVLQLNILRVFFCFDYICAVNPLAESHNERIQKDMSLAERFNEDFTFFQFDKDLSPYCSSYVNLLVLLKNTVNRYRDNTWDDNELKVLIATQVSDFLLSSHAYQQLVRNFDMLFLVKKAIQDIQLIRTGLYGTLMQFPRENAEYLRKLRKLNGIGCHFWVNAYTRYFRGNPSVITSDIEHRLFVPPEIYMQGANVVAEHLDELKQYGSKYLNEARIILLGEKGAGKTSFAKRFVKTDAELPTENDSTDGLDINFNDNKPIRLCDIVADLSMKDANVHIWDFAGHVITHAVHRFFLSEDCTYVVIYDGRTETRNRIEYWLEMISNFGKDSKIYIVVNIRDEQKLSINREKLKEKYSKNNIEIVEFSIGYDQMRSNSTQAHHRKALENFRMQIAKHITYSPSWDSRQVPQPLFEIKEKIDEMFAKGKEHISYDEYQEIVIDIMSKYPKHADLDLVIRKYLKRYLHSLGICLYYEKMQGFDKLVLNPVWITNGVYAIIKHLNDSAQFKICVDDFSVVFNSNKKCVGRYATEDYHYLYQLMLEFNLAFEIANERTLVIPSCMPTDQPKRGRMPTFEPGETLIMLIFAQTQDSIQLFIPADVMPRFIVRFSNEIYNGLVWREGVVLKSAQGSIARIIKDEQVIKVEVTLTDNHGYIKNIREELLSLLKDYDNFKNATKVKVALIGKDNRVTEEFFNYDDVQKLWRKYPNQYENPINDRTVFVGKTVACYGSD